MKRTARLLLASVAALALGLPSLTYANGVSGDLTLTVEELEDGGVRFTMSGSTTARTSGTVYQTPWFYDSGTGRYIPPSTLESGQSYSLPTGLAYGITSTDTSPPEEGDIEEGSGEIESPLSGINFASGGWYLYSTSHVFGGSLIRGIGSVTVPAPSSNEPNSQIEETLPPGIPFSNFVPGTYQVSGTYFDMTYVVVPYTPAPPVEPIASSPRITLSGPGRLPNAFVGRGASRGTVRIRNTGDVPVRNLRAAISGPGSRDFRATRPAPRQIAPGSVATSRILFRPTRIGQRRARLVVRSNIRPAATQLVGRGIRFGLPGPLRPVR